jgi:hypothetical protein
MMESSDPAASSERPRSTRVKSGLAEFMADPVFLCLLLAIVTLSLYWPATGFDFINYDDPLFVTQNPHIRHGLTWDSVRWALTAGLFDVDPNADYWRPLSYLSHALDVEWFGFDPGGHHLMNLGFHVAATVALFLALVSMTNALWRSAFVAALFAWHPLHVESVAWIAERKDVLSGLFWMLTMLMYARYAQKQPRVEPSPLRYAAPRSRESRAQTTPAPDTRPWALDYCLALLFFTLGLMSKPMVVTLPFALLLLDYWPLGRWRMDTLRAWPGQLPRLALEKAPFFLLSALSCIGTFLVQQQSKVMQSTASYPISGRIENMFASYSCYLWKTIWPENLTVFYPHPGHWPLVMVVPAAAFVLTACLGALWLGRRFPFLAIGWFWFLGTLIPVIGLVQAGIQSMADRYTYVPLIGIFIIISWGAAELFARWRGPKMIMAIMAGLVLIACAFRTRDQLGYWQNGGTVFRHAIAVTQNNYTAYYNLGIYLANKGLANEAMDNYRAAIRIDPNRMEPHLNLGIALEKAGRLDEAAKEYRTAVRIHPNSPEARFDLGCVLTSLGRRGEAIEQFRQALRLKPGFKLAELRLQELGVSPPY